MALDNASDDVSQVGEGLDAVQLAGLDEGRDRGPVLGASADLGLAIEREVIGVFADEDVGDGRLRRQPALDQAAGAGA